MSDFEAIETREQFEEAVKDRLEQERETVRREFSGCLSPEAVEEKYKEYLSPKEAEEKYNAFTIPSQYRPLIDTAVNVTASDGEYKNPVACTSLAKANGNLFFCIPKATNNYIFIDAEWEIK